MSATVYHLPSPCCDGNGQVHHGTGALSYVTPCRNVACIARRQDEWDGKTGPYALTDEHGDFTEHGWDMHSDAEADAAADHEGDE